MNINTEEFLKSNLFLDFKEENSHKFVVEAKDCEIYTAAKEVVKLRHMLARVQKLVLIFNDVKIEIDYKLSWQDIWAIYNIITTAPDKKLAHDGVLNYKEQKGLIKIENN